MRAVKNGVAQALLCKAATAPHCKMLYVTARRGGAENVKRGQAARCARAGKRWRKSSEAGDGSVRISIGAGRGARGKVASGGPDTKYSDSVCGRQGVAKNF